MAKFYVGQRVRIKWSECWPELGGEEATILAIGVLTGYSNNCIMLSVDAWGGIWSPGPGQKGGDCFAPLPEQLEPILDADDGITDEVRKELDRILSHEREGVAA